MRESTKESWQRRRLQVGIQLAELRIPEVVFTDPEIATVGESPTAVQERGGTPMVGQFPFGASGRAMTAEKTEGFVRLVGDRDG